MSTAVSTTITESEVYTLIRKAKRHLNGAGAYLRELREREAWKATAKYRTWAALVEGEFGFGVRQAQYLIGQDVVHEALTQASGRNDVSLSIAEAAAIRPRLPEAVERIEAGETVDAVVRDLTANGHAEPPIDAEIVESTPKLSPSSDPGGAVDVAVPPTPPGWVECVVCDGSGVMNAWDVATGEEINHATCGACGGAGGGVPRDRQDVPAARRARGGAVPVAGATDAEERADPLPGRDADGAALPRAEETTPDTLSTSPADPSPAESLADDGLASPGASEGAPPEHWAVAELALVREQLWEMTVARDAALEQAERLWKELTEQRDAAEKQRDTLAQVMWTGLGLLGFDTDGDDNPRATIAGMGYDGYAAMFIRECEETRRLHCEDIAAADPEPIPARSIVEEEPERFAEETAPADEQPADDERGRAVRKVLAWLDALPPKERSRFIRAHRIKDPSQWIHARTNAELTTLVAQAGDGEEGA